ncbi:MAG: TraR/DksA C4-type zinc finger protein [Patescibacteria group bacterium]|jgi:RNA polymerase-binding protein DksA|nr:TraR/DksA C4-type zinc finger protein [Patescibacteria group bacterium]
MSSKPSFSKEFLAKIEENLLKEKIKMENELNKFAKKNPDVENDYNSTFPDYGDKEDENASEVADYETNLALEKNLEKNLRDVVNSLQRIKKGTYGICKYCKKPIEEKRLLARPTSNACMECKKAIKQEF